MILIGNPDNRRTAGMQAARERLGLPPAVVLPYLELLQGRASLAAAASSMRQSSADRPPLLRLDAPGEHFGVERELIALGAPDVGGELTDRLLPEGTSCDPQPLSRLNALALTEQLGRLYHPSQWFRGYARLLARLEEEADRLWPGGGAAWLNAPEDITAMFDKRRTHRVLAEAGVPVPRLLAPPAELPHYEALREVMLGRRLHRVFIKLAVGSGACGVIAYQINPRTGAEVAETSLGAESFLFRPPIFYNARRLQRYSGREEISRLVNWLLQQGAHVEQWIAKAAYGNRTYDIRQLVAGGSACHSTARISRTPITNLHLRSERMSLQALGLSEEEQHRVRTTAERAVGAFPRSFSAGVDVLLGRRDAQPYVLDVNPFGDLLYHVEYEGRSTYEWELLQLERIRRIRRSGDGAAVPPQTEEGRACRI